ncbi:MAG: PilW family protein [Gammaproteobacteria bacterium]|nr:PilW family protein [Gammaproteobacteria bacterium]MDH5617213.1 PilW family protein [Gammaproteobacteria bacterium]
MNVISSRKKQSGVSLVEVMIAMLLGIFLLGSVVQFFVSSRQSNRVHEATSRLQETGRMALEVMARDIRMADFWGCASDITSVVNNLNSANAGYVDYQTGGVAGTEGGAGAPDTLILRGGFGTGLNLEPPYGPQASANLKVAAGNDLAQGDIILVSDCTSGDIFQISNSNPGGAGTVVHNTGSTTVPGNYNATNPGCPGANAHCLSKVYGADASIFRVQEIVYSVGAGSEGEPALFRNGAEFLDGVEDLQILYGEDTDAPGTAGEGIANYFVPADQVADMERVIGIRIAIVARSSNDNLVTGNLQSFAVLGANETAADRRIRRVYETTVNIRNRQ